MPGRHRPRHAANGVARASEPGSQPESETGRLLREEGEALGKILHAFRDYRNEAEREVLRWERNYSQLSERHRSLLPSQTSKFARARECIRANSAFIDQILGAVLVDQHDPDTFARMAFASSVAQVRTSRRIAVSPGDADKVRYVLKNLTRDWAAEGAPERAQSYGRIASEAVRVLGRQQPGSRPPRVLVPGAGLGRLCLDLAALGYEAQGNEFSYYMLLTSALMLNGCEAAGQWAIHPWMHSNCNHVSDADQLRAVAIPDVAPADALAGTPGLLSMCAGDFVEVYGAPGQGGAWDCVATCFFLDTAHNLVQYMEVIRHCLKEGGVWLNLGPLLYHWADAHTYLPGEELSVEVSLDDVEHVAAQLGFHTLRREMVPAAFNADLRSMLLSNYRCVFSTMVKTAGPNHSGPATAAAGASSGPG